MTSFGKLVVFLVLALVFLPLMKSASGLQAKKERHQSSMRDMQKLQESFDAAKQKLKALHKAEEVVVKPFVAKSYERIFVVKVPYTSKGVKYKCSADFMKYQRTHSKFDINCEDVDQRSSSVGI